MRRERTFWVYILASRIGGTLYIGVTSDLVRRVYEHKEKLIPGFTSEYGVHRLVYYEQHATAESAIRREKRLKKLEPSLENRADRKGQSKLGRPLSCDRLPLKRHPRHTPPKAGTQ